MDNLKYKKDEDVTERTGIQLSYKTPNWRDVGGGGEGGWW